MTLAADLIQAVVAILFVVMLVAIGLALLEES